MALHHDIAKLKAQNTDLKIALEAVVNEEKGAKEMAQFLILKLKKEEGA